MDKKAIEFCQACIDKNSELVNSMLQDQDISKWVNTRVPLTALTRHGTNANVQVTTAVDIAIRRSPLAVMVALLEAGARVEDINGYQYTCLHAAAGCTIDRVDKTEYILTHHPQLLLAKTKHQQAAIHLAALYGHSDVIAILVQRGCSVNLKGWSERSPVHTAAAGGHAECLDALVGLGGDPSAREEDQRTPIHLASEFGRVGCIRTLLNTHHVDINQNTKFGNKPLHRSAYNGHLSAVQALASYPECDALITNNAHQTALDIAKDQNHSDVIEFLNTFTTMQAANRPMMRAVSALRRKIEGQPDAPGLKQELAELKGMMAAKTEGATGAMDRLVLTDDQKETENMKIAIRFQTKYLVDNIDANNHLDFLYSRFAITNDELKEIRKLSSPTRKMQELLAILMDKRDSSWAPIFLQSLRENENSQHAAKRVENTDTSKLGKEIR